MEILIDTREKEHAIQNILSDFNRENIIYDRSKLYIGDYMSLDNARRVVDRKQNLEEICQNICSEGKRGKTSETDMRFRKELERSKIMRVGIIFLIEHGNGVKTLDDVRGWINPQRQKHKYAWSGEELCRRMKLLLHEYPYIRFMFCDKKDTGKRIIEILRK